MVPRKTGLRKFWPDLEISEAFWMDLGVSNLSVFLSVWSSGVDRNFQIKIVKQEKAVNWWAFANFH